MMYGAIELGGTKPYVTVVEGRRPALAAAARTSRRALGGYLPRAVAAAAPEFRRSSGLDDDTGLSRPLKLGGGMNADLRAVANTGGP